MSFVIWHNPRCSKSRATLGLLQEAGVSIEERRYLDEAPTEAELKDVLGKLGLQPSGLIRRKEALVKELGLDLSDEDAVLAAMVAHPKLIERPIVVHGSKAVLGRPPENVNALL